MSFITYRLSRFKCSYVALNRLLESNERKKDMKNLLQGHETKWLLLHLLPSIALADLFKKFDFPMRIENLTFDDLFFSKVQIWSTRIDLYIITGRTSMWYYIPRSTIIGYLFDYRNNWKKPIKYIDSTSKPQTNSCSY